MTREEAANIIMGRSVRTLEFVEERLGYNFEVSQEQSATALNLGAAALRRLDELMAKTEQQMADATRSENYERADAFREVYEWLTEWQSKEKP